LVGWNVRPLPGRRAHVVPARRKVRLGRRGRRARKMGSRLPAGRPTPPSPLPGGRYGSRGVDGGQGEAVRVPQADGTLVALPVDRDDALMPSLLTLTDVMGTGHHAAVAADVGAGKTVAVVGDGAVGLCGVIAAKRLGAEQIILLGNNAERISLGQEFGATDVVRDRGDDAVEGGRER